MRKIIFAVLLVAVLISGIAFAEEILPPNTAPAEQNPLRKLGRGLQNITIGGPLQLGKDVEDTFKEDGLIAASTYGVIKGFAKGALRFCVGVYETFTFIIPGPEGYKPIMKDPEFFLQNDPEFPESKRENS